jgi:hypothetical protein
MKADKGKLSAWDLDLRVRARLIGAGQLDAKAIERHLAELPDLEAQSESLNYEQPALSDNGDNE